ncbi:hypothetical protein JQ597_32640 [Bradyrhizobium sp. AUGA SZCCT0177]|uniref:hypothetical protein n=1 Tax=Bradyrhizobium sp. AUGA SZCCT0177 TaxID=2807665 RepID=UPI001BAE268B|nr:hypothetical protein [Bradyrhizobium sp. AUGA SZCCT0177]MBR1286814.1 hypothetical protein [Bradyrhizobium sp. AUGA SZCCT0177]
MTAEERLSIRRGVAELRAAIEPDDGPENRMARLQLITSLLLAYPITNAAPGAARAQGEAYLAALDDIPPKIVEEVIRRWHRGEYGPSHNYRWRPLPAEMRQLCQEHLRPGRETIARLNTLLNALSFERAMDPKPIDPVVESDSAHVVHVKTRRA